MSPAYLQKNAGLRGCMDCAVFAIAVLAATHLCRCLGGENRNPPEEGTTQPLELVTQEEMDAMAAEQEKAMERFRQRVAEKPPEEWPREESEWQSVAEKAVQWRPGLAFRSAHLSRVRTFRLVPPDLSIKVQQMLKEEIAKIEAQSSENITYVVDTKSIYELL